MFSYVSLEQQLLEDDLLRTLRKLIDKVLPWLGAGLEGLYAGSGQLPIAPEYILRALLMQVFSLFARSGDWLSRLTITFRSAGSLASGWTMLRRITRCSRRTSTGF